MPTYNKEFSAKYIISLEEESSWFSECKHEFSGFQHIYPKRENTDLLQKAVKWFKWEEKNGRVAKLEQTGTLDSLYSYIASAMYKFLRHCFINRKQTESYQLDNKTQSFDSNTMILQMDFDENYTCTAKDGVQSAHWKQAQITMYTSVAWFRSDIFSHIIINGNLI